METIFSVLLLPLIVSTHSSLPPVPITTSEGPSPIVEIIPSPTPTPTATPKPTRTPSPTRIPTSVPLSSSQLDEWFRTYANKESIDPDLLKRIAWCESKYTPHAVNGDYLGMYQFSASTWQSTRKAMNLDTNPSLRTDAEQSIRTAAFRIATRGPAAWPNCRK